mmetsp:Transcript_80542/g.215030  ORF Transcript_80542/g.215030 Transcript_80542/m.215030 type:complete len:171 (-) Transcript_80542:200-712(-)
MWGAAVMGAKHAEQKKAREAQQVAVPPAGGPDPSSSGDLPQMAPEAYQILQQRIQEERLAAFQAGQMAALTQSQQPITIVNQMSSKTENTLAPNGDGPKKATGVLDFLREFFGSTFNRLCFFACLGLGGYTFHQYMTTRWRMQERQQVIDSNFLLRGTQQLFQNEKRWRA